MVERKRHLAKAVTYRVFGSAATAAIAYAVTGEVKVGAVVGVADTVVKIGLYYIHERAWYRIRWGVRAGSGETPATKVVITERGRSPGPLPSANTGSAATRP